MLVFARPGVDDDTLGTALATSFDGAFNGSGAALDVTVGGAGVVDKAINSKIQSDLGRAESIAVPVTLVLLLFVFGSAVSAVLPFSVAVGAILGAFFVLWLVAMATNVSVFALNLVTGLGLGLGIDYSLLIVNRFREELSHDPDVEGAVARTIASAGRTVVISSATVCVVMVALLFFPQYFLKSFGYAGIVTTALASLSAVTVLPALLAALGPKVDLGKVRRRDMTPREDGTWARTAARVMRHPWPVLVGGLIVMGVLASPALDSTLRNRGLPVTSLVGPRRSGLQDAGGRLPRPECESREHRPRKPRGRRRTRCLRGPPRPGVRRHRGDDGSGDHLRRSHRGRQP